MNRSCFIKKSNVLQLLLDPQAASVYESQLASLLGHIVQVTLGILGPENPHLSPLNLRFLCDWLDHETIPLAVTQPCDWQGLLATCAWPSLQMVMVIHNLHEEVDLVANLCFCASGEVGDDRVLTSRLIQMVLKNIFINIKAEMQLKSKKINKLE